ncbi:MAG: FHA domain-containing protein [Lachnospiraceae bacterium]
MAYGLFQESQKENYSMEDLLKILLPKTPKSIPEKKRPVFQEPILEKEVLFEEFEETVAEKKENSRSKRKKLPSLVIAAGSLFGLYFFLGMDGIRSFGWVSALMGLGSAGINCWLDRKPRTKKKQGRGKEQRPDREQQKEVDQWKEIWGEELVEEPAPLQEEPIMEKNTVLLADLDVLDGRYRLVPLQQELPVIQLAYYPFVIGKQEPMADGIIPKETVSRLHARIDKTEAGFFLTDLNSTNGTMVNGRALEANETVSIQAGDQIYIADAGFLFSK